MAYAKLFRSRYTLVQKDVSCILCATTSFVNNSVAERVSTLLYPPPTTTIRYLLAPIFHLQLHMVLKMILYL